MSSHKKYSFPMCNFEERLHTDTKTAKKPPHNCICAHKHGHANVDVLLVWRRVRIWGTAEEWHRAVYRRIHK